MIELAWITGLLIMLLGASMKSVIIGTIGAAIECVVVYVALRG